MSKKAKNVSQGYVVGTNGFKIPKLVENPDAYFSKKTVWNFSRCDIDHVSWSLSCCQNLFNDIILKLIDFERRTWSDIESDKKHNHWIDASDLSPDAQRRLSERYPEYDRVFSLRLTGKLRLIGTIQNGTFFIFWYDPEHQVCISHKKHT